MDRDINDSEQGISSDWRFGIAYNAALKLCTILLYAEGFRPSHGVEHYRTIAALSFILGSERKADGDGSLELTFRVAGLDEIKRWILSFGPEAVVLEPKKLKELVREDLSSNMAQYSKGPVSIKLVKEIRAG